MQDRRRSSRNWHCFAFLPAALGQIQKGRHDTDAGGQQLIFSTRDELSTVGSMQPTRPRQFGAASAGAESKWRASAAAPERAAHAVLRRKNGARAFRWAMQALPFRHAHDLGVNLFDTAAAYGTESVVGQAIKSAPRESVVIATKAWVPPGESRRPRCEEPRRLAPAARHRLHRHLSATRRFAQSLRRGAIHHSARAPGGSERRVRSDFLE
jgi:aldo/keto reductase family protein